MVKRRPASERGYGISEFIYVNPDLERWYQKFLKGQVKIKGLKARFKFAESFEDVPEGRSYDRFYSLSRPFDHPQTDRGSGVAPCQLHYARIRDIRNAFNRDCKSRHWISLPETTMDITSLSRKRNL